MAKKKRTNSAVSAIGALRNSIKAVSASERAKVDPDLSEEEKAVIVNNAMDSVDNTMDILEDSNLTTVLENTDDSIALQHEMAAGELTAGEEEAITEQEQAWAAEEQKEQSEQDGVGAPDIE